MALLILTTLAVVMAQPVPGARSVKADPATLGPAVGQPIPSFEAWDQNGRRREFASLAGPNGLVLVFFRSADW
jgi:hypothetical protein